MVGREMNANELADYITENSYIGTVTMEDVATMLRQQQAEIEALKMGFADSGTSDSELAEVRAFANRQILKNKELQAEVERLQQEYAKVFENHWSEQQ